MEEKNRHAARKLPPLIIKSKFGKRINLHNSCELPMNAVFLFLLTERRRFVHLEEAMDKVRRTSMVEVTNETTLTTGKFLSHV